ncbi:myosin phosphatase Rho-interacting protein-like [Oncorhynchus masou masou]|uniref:myosin phosphatase Rho-interacting protein-like n=1 Tax=Oncorhynchus masou masou TaxID=90313 RepID=UPI0031840D2D
MDDLTREFQDLKISLQFSQGQLNEFKQENGTMTAICKSLREDISAVWTTGRGGPGDSPRLIVVKSLRFKDKLAVLERAKNLSGTYIFLNEDYPEFVLQKRKELIHESCHVAHQAEERKIKGPRQSPWLPALLVMESTQHSQKLKEELCSFQREIEVLSEQYTQKCLENAHLAQALEAERQALRQCQRENQELNAHNQELNNRLAAEITKMRSMATEDGGGNTCNITHGKELYELEVMLRVKESEVQYLKQEINSLRDELQAAQRDKKYATDKYKDIYTELSIVKAKAERDLGRLREQLQLAHVALGEPSLEGVERAGGYDIMKSKSNPDILKMAAAAAKRTMRSKSLKEGLTAEQRLHLFDKDTKEF